jgi:hypothetical protein
MGIVRTDFVLGSQLTVTGLVADRLGLVSHLAARPLRRRRHSAAHAFTVA